MGVKEILDKYIKDLNENNKGYENNENPLVINKDWENYNKEKIDVIYVGDNPGEEEKKQNKYLVGPSGIKAQNFIQVNNKIFGFENHLIFNKTPYFSKKTLFLNKKRVLKKDKEEDKIIKEAINTNYERIKESISLTVECIYKLWKINKDMKIFVFGIDEKAHIVKDFFLEIMTKEESFLEAIFYLYHPSNNWLFASFGQKIFEQFNNNGESITLDYYKLLKEVDKQNKDKLNITRWV